MGDHGRRWTRAAGLALLIVLAGPAGSAHADPAGPTHYRSTVEQVDAEDGSDPAFEVEILGGDAFLVLHADPGVTVEVPGYEGEPYLRFDATGLVEVNDRSRARWLNDERYGTGRDVPPSADPAAPPAWRAVADDGVYAWHDHRIHFMSPNLPPDVDTSQRRVQHVMDWEIPVVADGTIHLITGTLVWVPGPSPMVPVGALLLAVVVAGGAAAGWRRTGPVVVTIPVSAVALAAGSAMVLGLPPGTDGEAALVALPVASVVLAVTGAMSARRRPLPGAMVQMLAGAPVLVWSILLSGALVRPIVPGALPTGIVRVAVTVVAAGALAVLVSGAMRVRDAREPDRAQPPS